MVKPTPASSLIVSQPKLLLQILVVPLDAPAHLGDEHHLLQRGLLWRRAEKVFGWFIITFGPLDQQPLFRAHLGAEIIAVSRTHSQRGETPAEFTVGALGAHRNPDTPR